MRSRLPLAVLLLLLALAAGPYVDPGQLAELVYVNQDEFFQEVIDGMPSSDPSFW